MNTRKLVVSNEQKAIELMKEKLDGQVADAVLEFPDEIATGVSSRRLFLMWLSRDRTTNEWIGCPCFACDFNGKNPETGEAVQGIVYVKAFATQVSDMTQVYFIRNYLDYGFSNIEEGELFTMHDEYGRYEDEDFIFRGGEIIPV